MGKKWGKESEKEREKKEKERRKERKKGENEGKKGRNFGRKGEKKLSLFRKKGNFERGVGREGKRKKRERAGDTSSFTSTRQPLTRLSYTNKPEVKLSKKNNYQLPKVALA